MLKTTCPFLGLRDDPTTALDFPSEGNYCHHAQPIAQVKRAHQQTYCLTADHTICPIYQAAQPLPAAIVEPSYERSQSRRRLAMIAGATGLAVITALLIAWNTLGSRPIPKTGGDPPSAVDHSMLNSNFLGIEPSSEPTPASSIQPSIAGCPLPDGWVPYIVTPTDSLYRLSIIYGVTVAELQTMNCMGQQTALLPNQVIYVPFVPTVAPTMADTPPAINTPLPQPRPRPNVQPTAVPTRPPSQPTNPPSRPANPPGDNNSGQDGNGNGSSGDGHGNGNHGNGKGHGHGH